jgi:hypothetical protein
VYKRIRRRQYRYAARAQHRTNKQQLLFRLLRTQPELMQAMASEEASKKGPVSASRADLTSGQEAWCQAKGLNGKNGAEAVATMEAEYPSGGATLLTSRARERAAEAEVVPLVEVGEQRAA